MAQTLHLPIDDTSPTILYSPFAAHTFAANLTAGWNPYFNVSGFVTALGQTGNGTSFHVTSRNQASFSVTWKGTGIQLLGSTLGNAGYNVTLDGASQVVEPNDEILVAFQNLSDASHTLSITTVIPGNQGTFYFDKAVISFNAPSSPSPDLQALNDSDILFQGKWGFQNGTSESLHESMTANDVARTTFSGAAIFLSGTTSPQGGTYSVILDNVTSTFSGQASFTNSDALLFFATGLDPTIEHDIQVVNDDGSDLALKVGGFQAIATGLASTPTPQPVSGTSAARSKGTIAALVLAGILGFLIISGCLYYSLVIRSRRRRRRQARFAYRMKQEQVVDDLGVIDIGPLSLPDDGEMGTQPSTMHYQKRSSGKSGFLRWKREVEGGFGTLAGLGISFRHSDSNGRKSAASGKESGRPWSAKSSIFTFSSPTRSQGKGKKKAKTTHVSESSWSASFALELPVRPDSADSDKEKDVGPSHFTADTRLSITSGVHTLSYMSTPSPRSTPTPAPPSYSISSSNRNSNSNSLSVPHSTRRHSGLVPQTHSYPDNGGILLISDSSKPVLLEEDLTQSYEPPAPPIESGHLSTLAPRDRGSAQYSSDDATSYLGSAATRLAIRGLSPRTSKFQLHPSSEEVDSREPRGTPDFPLEPKMTASEQETSPPESETSFLNVVTPAARPVEMLPAEAQSAGPYLDVVPSSPFAITFSNSPLRQGQESSDIEVTSGDASPEERNLEPRTPRSIFRLTPPSLNFHPLSSAGHWRDSFLDFGASSDISHRSRSIDPSIISQNHDEAEQSRWSESASQATDPSHNASSDVSMSIISPTSGPTSYFPYPVSLPASPHHPEGHIPSRVDPSIIAPRGPRPVDRHPARALRLSAFGSPTDSVPISVRERVLRHSGSTEGSGNLGNSSQLPPHPPLPDLPPDVTIPPP